MLKTFDKKYFTSHRGCYSHEKMANLCDNNAHTTLEDFLNWDIPIKDKFYFVINYCDLNIKQFKFLALECAKSSLKFYTVKYPNDNRIAECIATTEKYLNGNCTLEFLKEKRDAAADAVYTAAYAAAAADTAAVADAAEATDKTHTNNLLQMLKDFCNNQI